MFLLGKNKEIAYARLRSLLLLVAVVVALNQNLTAFLLVIAGVYGVLLAYKTRRDLHYQVLPRKLSYGLLLLWLLAYFSLHQVRDLGHLWDCTFNFFYVTGQYVIIVWLLQRFPGIHLPGWQMVTWDVRQEDLTIRRMAKVVLNLPNADAMHLNLAEEKARALAELPWWKRWLYGPWPLQILIVLGLTGAGVVLYGLGQHFFQVAPTGDWIDTFANPLLKTRVFSTWENPNIFAGYLCMLGAYLMAFISVQKDKRWRWGLAVYLLCTGLCLVYTYSRGFWAALGVELVCFTLLFYRRGWGYLAALLAGAVVTAGPAVQQRLQTLTSVHDTSAELHLAYLEIVRRIIRDYPWGIGWYNYQFVFPDYDYIFKDPTVPMYHCHNFLLNITAETGFQGLLVFLGCWFVVLHQAWLLQKQAARGWERAVGRGYILMSIGLFVGGLADHVLFNVRLGILFWLLTVLVVVVRKYARLER
ncbi:MAG: O-antigen ligase family protein [Acidaminococcaceae bacterium]|jgi:putative inorganic carbon (HCO3(-)) transporter|nr:O-antigen ligase family protein [Acidaminococcaceae bacterium]